MKTTNLRRTLSRDHSRQARRHSSLEQFTPADIECEVCELLIAGREQGNMTTTNRLNAHLERCTVCRQVAMQLPPSYVGQMSAEYEEPHADVLASSFPRVSLDRYDVQSTMSIGGMGRILLAYDQQLCRQVA